MHEIIHLEPTPAWKKQPRKKSLPKATKRLEINTPSKGICKGTTPQQKQKCTKGTKTLQINTLEGIWKRKSNYSITFNYIYINILMVPGHQFQVYLTLTKSCIYARNHTLRTSPPFLEKATSQIKRVYHKLQKGLKSILLQKEFGRKKPIRKYKNLPKLQTRYKPILF